MAKARTPRNAWIDVALEALAAGGPEAVRIEALAARLGVSKGGFYWHFDDRAALLDELLERWEQRVVGDVVAAVEDGAGDPRAKLRRLFELAAAARDLLPAELALRDWARHDAAVARRLRRVDDQRMDYLRSLFRPICDDDDDAEARSMLAFSLFVGSPFIAAGHPGRSRRQVLQLAVNRLVAESWS